MWSQNSLLGGTESLMSTEVALARKGEFENLSQTEAELFYLGAGNK